MSAFTVRKRLGRCYELAGKALTIDRAFSDDAVLVHGMVTSPFSYTPLQTIDHAWVEDGDRLWDPTLNRFYARADYYSRFDAVALDLPDEPPRRRRRHSISREDRKLARRRGKRSRSTLRDASAKPDEAAGPTPPDEAAGPAPLDEA